MPMNKNTWIPVKLRLPRDGDTVETKIEGGGEFYERRLKYRRKDGRWELWGNYVHDHPTHWRPYDTH
jgi:hypothetical protein